MNTLRLRLAVTGGQVVQLRYLPLLTFITLVWGRWCSAVTDGSLVALGRGCAGLEALDASFCYRVTDKASNGQGE